jgi:hypothetical protein
MEMSITRSRKIREKWNEIKMEMSITQPRKLEKMEWNPIERAAAVLGCIYCNYSNNNQIDSGGSKSAVSAPLGLAPTPRATREATQHSVVPRFYIPLARRTE